MRFCVGLLEFHVFINIWDDEDIYKSETNDSEQFA